MLEANLNTSHTLLEPNVSAAAQLPSSVVMHRRRKRGGRGGICPHKNILVGAVPPPKYAAVTDGENLTSQVSPRCSERQCGPVSFEPFVAELVLESAKVGASH